MKENKKILLVGDSLGLPREDLEYEHTWPYLLRKKQINFHFIERFVRANTTNCLASGLAEDWLEFYCPKIVIMQLGIVDCAPRYIRNQGFVNKFIAILPRTLRDLIWVLIKRSRNRSSKYADVSIDDFFENLKAYVERCAKIGVESVFLVQIASISADIRKKSPEFYNQVKLYNQKLYELCKLYEFCILESSLCNRDDIFLSDGYHLNSSGQKILMQSLEEKLTLST